MAPMVLALMHKTLFMGDFKMKAHYKYFIRGTILTVLVVVCLATWTKILIPKYYYNTTWATTATYQGFYEMEKGTVDVLFLGSSHAAAAFNVQQLYNEYGITGYNLGCEQQNLLVSYYWLKEALRFQSPKAVVVDLLALFEWWKEEPLNSTESCTRKAMDYMKWSPVKIEAVKDICSIDKNQFALSYYLPNIRFHTRWGELSEDDFASDLSSHYELKGFCPLAGKSGYTEYRPFEERDSDNIVEPVGVMENYLNRMIGLCEEKGIKLILVKTPTVGVSVEKYNMIKKIADEHNIVYYDFNESQLYNKIDFDFTVDMHDATHGSISGSIKIMDFIGDVLMNTCSIKGKYDAQWEQTKSFYESVLNEYNMVHTTDIYDYLKMINDKRYSLFISAKDEASVSLNEEVISLMKKLGLNFELAGQYRASYLAVITEEDVYEDIGKERLEYYGTVRDGIVRFELASAGAESGDVSSIKIAGEECSKNQRGLNIVVYDNLLKRKVDSVAFDTFAPELTALR